MNALGILIIIVNFLVQLAVLGALIYLFVLIVRALKKYIGSKDVREEKKSICKSLGEVLKENRLRCKMTQEFVAESLSVSRQAVSKWENGTSDPSTSNLIALAKLYGISSEELLKSADSSLRRESSESPQSPTK
ncbi:MAG: helix-turn-helix transcriptional regulator [Eubacteriales bacterium]|nr:helix-turn-helix transcriptional regulator [Eubacteriales bacterium]